MRALLLLLISQGLVHAQGNLLPREGSGWEGFKPGTSIRIKHTFARPGRLPAVTISSLTLKSVQDKVLVVRSVSKNALGLEQAGNRVLPRGGEAGENETATSRKLPNETIEAAGKKFECSQSEITVTGAAGDNRVVTEWTSLAEPRMRIKRSEVWTGPKGKETQRYTMVLAETAKPVEVGTRKVTTLVYAILRTATQKLAPKGKASAIRWSGRATVSRDIPGYQLREETEMSVDGKLTQTIRMEVLEFDAK